MRHERITGPDFGRHRELAAAFHRIHGIEEKIQKNLLHLICVSPDCIEACLQRPGEFDLLLIQPMLNELERFLQYFVHVHRPEQWFCRACEPKQLIDQRIDPINLVHDQAGKGFAEIRLVVALRQGAEQKS